MKTPIEELIEVLKIHRDTAYEKARRYESEHYHSRGQAFNDAISFAEVQLEKEKKVMYDAWLVAISNFRNDTFFEEYYNETFNTKEK